jgi:molybdopterin/thiamine biosynthesis adenylyltransferase/rhodanese-related sulfurtransferase
MSTLRALLDCARSAISETDPNAFDEFIRRGSLLLDCREAEETASGYIDGALRLPRGLIEPSIERICPDRSRRIAIYCASGVRSALAAQTLATMGYEQPVSLRGGLEAWKASGRSVVLPVSEGFDRSRYLSQLKLPEISESGQRQLKAARVLVIGAGGLGSPAALYLGAAGVGQMTIVDNDVVDLSNLQRQILHTTDRIGIAKVDSASMTLRALNPEVRITRVAERLDEGNGDALVSDHDIVVDGTDNLRARYLLNRLCNRHRKPWIHGSVHQWQAQLAVFTPPGPCYECAFPAPPTGDMAPNCAEAGVLGAVTGVVGSFMACEAIKLICCPLNSLASSMVLLDLRHFRMQRLLLESVPGCPCCSAVDARCS